MALASVVVLILACGSSLAAEQWVRVGFLTNQPPDVAWISASPDQGAVTLEVTRKGHSGQPCWISQPVALSGSAQRPCEVFWTRDGTEFHREIVLPEASPAQVLLIEPDSESSQSQADGATPPRVTLAPNPFNSTALLTFDLSQAAHARIVIFDVLGRHVQSLWDAPLPAGQHRWQLEGSTWSSGTYFLSYRFAPGASGVHRFQLLK